MNETVANYPAIAMRGMVVLPGCTTHFDISNGLSRRAVNAAMTGNQLVFLVCQKNTDTDEPGIEDVCSMGTIARIRQVIKMPKDIIRILAEGIQRAELYAFTDCEEYPQVQAKPVGTENADLGLPVMEAMEGSIRDNFLKYASASGKIPKDTLQQARTIRGLEKMVDFAVGNMDVDWQKKQILLEERNLQKRYEDTLRLLFREMEVTAIRNELQEKVKEQIDRHQKEYVLREQLGVIREELGENDTGSETDQYRKQLEALTASDEVKKHIEKEIRRFAALNPMSPESAVARNYIETLLELPWDKRSADNRDLDRAQEILNRDHYGLEQVKDRILDFLAVRNLTEQGESPILCLVGPPGTGKTSIARSIAEALEKKYVRVCLGGVRDEAEIRGHRRTYVSAMPGRIVEGLKQAGVSNPLMLLDEIDKASSDYKGDTSAALLEVLDGEQNSHFRDHFVEVPIDLSEVLFLATANDPQKIPGPLKDRMEIIEIAGYTENEKFHIAAEHLWQKQLKANGLTAEQLLAGGLEAEEPRVTEEALRRIIRGYTREAGVRALERRLGEICRKSARAIYQKKTRQILVTEENLTDYLGREKFRPDHINEEDEAGIVRGLAWTAVGGVTLEVEVNCVPGKGTFLLTGKLGDVMKESAQAGISYLRSIASSYDIEPRFFETHDIHIHIPEGATPKDGPSAGITMATAMLSAITGIPVRRDVAMTGEITIRGRVLPIGGLKEKLLAAKTAGITTVCIPADNAAELEEISQEITEGMTITPVRTLGEVLDIALVRPA